MMLSLIRIELKRAFSGAYFWIAVAIGCVVTVAGFLSDAYPTLWINDTWLTGISKFEYPSSVFNRYIGLGMETLYYLLYFLLAPLLASLPFADSYYTDIHGGYAKHICTRGSRRCWLISKYITVFLSGAATFAIPLVVNLVITAMYFPAVNPISLTSTFFAAGERVTFSGLFLSHPWLYLFLYLLIGCAVIGLFAEIALVVALYAKSKFVVILFPFVVYVAVYAVCTKLGVFAFVPYHVINATATGVPASAPIVVLLILFLATFPLFIIKGGKSDVL